MSSYRKPVSVDTATYIDDGLIGFIENRLDNGNYNLPTELSTGEIYLLTEIEEMNSEGDYDFLYDVPPGYVSYHGRSRFMFVDGDNDGCRDIVVYHHIGGTAGYAYIEFFRGDNEGGYLHSYSSFINIYTTGCGFVKYSGKNYFLAPYYDYNRKVQTGFELFCFEDGAPVEWAEIHRKPVSYSLSDKTVLSGKYAELADKLENEAADIYFAREFFCGSAEEKSDEGYTSDIDNDGILETYRKHRFEPTGRRNYEHLEFECSKGAGAYDLYKEFGLDFGSDDKRPQNLWVESVDGENIICVLSTMGNNSNIYVREHRDDFKINCYFLHDGSYEEVIKLSFEPDYTVTTGFYTDGLNRDLSYIRKVL